MAVAADPTNVMGRRIGAVFIDGALVLVPFAAVLTSNLEYIEKDQLSGRTASDFCNTYLDQYGNSNVCVAAGDTAYYGDPGAAPFVTLAALAIGMYVVLQGLTGWTVGKLLTGIRTVREDGARVGLVRALVRWLLWIVDGLPFLGLVALITGLTTTGHRRVGDMAAKTFVVRASAAGQAIVVPGLTGPPLVPGAPPPPGAWGTPPPGAWAPPPPTPAAAPGPQWDEARGTYIQWDPAQTAWMQWDDTAKQWNAIPTAPPPLAPPPTGPPPPAPPPPSSAPPPPPPPSA